ncbi:hypothetical protein [Phaeodactylibacter xiamenensis]|uniref:hypothetical protein n=1 Tax=Phaeodactylibacter xiamenensis TaxID=1524460 RepID=UPI003CCBEF9B
MVQQRHNRSSDAGRIAICESWAEHLEQVYTDREFGGNTSLFPAGRTRERELELTRNHRLNHVPIGLHFDLFDNQNDLNDACDRVIGSGCGPIADNVAGFTNGELFSILDENTTDPDIYQAKVINDLLPGSGNTVADVNALFNSY